MLSAGEGGVSSLPLWPAKEYALLCATHEWANADASEIPISEFFKDIAPRLQARGIRARVFPKRQGPTIEGIDVAVGQLVASIREELTTGYGWGEGDDGEGDDD